MSYVTWSELIQSGILLCSIASVLLTAVTLIGKNNKKK